MAARFKRGDLVQLRSEAQWNPSLFRIRSIFAGKAVLGQLSPDDDEYCGVDTEIALDNPELIAPSPEILTMYSRHVRHRRPTQ
jgi:hypothetical protein